MAQRNGRPAGRRHRCSLNRLQLCPGALPESHDVRRHLWLSSHLSNLRQPLQDRLQALMVGWERWPFAACPLYHATCPPLWSGDPHTPKQRRMALTTLCQLADSLLPPPPPPPPPPPHTHRWGTTSWCMSLAGFKRVRTVLPNSCSFCIKDVSGSPVAVWGSQMLAMQRWRLWRRSCCRLPVPLRAPLAGSRPHRCSPAPPLPAAMPPLPAAILL